MLELRECVYGNEIVEEFLEDEVKYAEDDTGDETGLRLQMSLSQSFGSSLIAS